MSPQNGMDAPKCATENRADYIVGTFYEPAAKSGQFATVYHPADAVQIAWSGDSPGPTKQRTLSLFLQNSTAGVAYLQFGAMEIFVNNTFLFARASWTYDGEPCGNTVMRYDWIVPPLSDLNGSRFQLVARPELPTGDLYFSPGFSILPSLSTSSTVVSPSSTSSIPPSSASASTTAQSSPIDTTTSASSVVRPVSNELSDGKKAGIEVGSSAVVLLVIFGILLFFRRRRQGNKAAPLGHVVSEIEKAEMDGAGAEKAFGKTHESRVTELHDQSIGEMSGIVEGKDVAELPANDNRV